MPWSRRPCAWGPARASAASAGTPRTRAGAGLGVVSAMPPDCAGGAPSTAAWRPCAGRPSPVTGCRPLLAWKLLGRALGQRPEVARDRHGVAEVGQPRLQRPDVRRRDRPCAACARTPGWSARACTMPLGRLGRERDRRRPRGPARPARRRRGQHRSGARVNEKAKARHPTITVGRGRAQPQPLRWPCTSFSSSSCGKASTQILPRARSCTDCA